MKKHCVTPPMVAIEQAGAIADALIQHRAITVPSERYFVREAFINA